MNLVGQKFGKLLVIEKHPEKKHRSIQWVCKCECGNIKILKTGQLTSGDYKSCGCSNKEFQQIARDKRYDITGQRFGKLTAIRKISKSGPSVWEFKCDCSSLIELRTQSVITHGVKSCKNCKGKNIKGLRYGSLVVISKAGKGYNGAIQWLCKCDCGNEVIISGVSLRDGSRINCGPNNKDHRYRKYEKDLSGKKFGKLLVIMKISDVRYKQDHYLCRCDCGNEKTIRGYSLIYGTAVSCGCYAKELASVYKIPTLEKSLRNAHKIYIRNAKIRNLIFELTFEQFTNLIMSNCSYCGTEPSRDFSRRDEKEGLLSGIDRIDSDGGYTLENCTPCCTMCNRAKSVYKLDLFIDWIKRVYNHLNLNGD